MSAAARVDVLFVCVHNAGRSQMADAFFKAEAAARGLPFTSASAGTEPAGRVHPEVAVAMREAGVEIGGAQPTLMTDAMAASAGRVVTMGCRVDSGTCPAILLAKVEDWGLPDPKGRSPAEVAGISDEVRRRVSRLLDELVSQRRVATAGR